MTNVDDPAANRNSRVFKRGLWQHANNAMILGMKEKILDKEQFSP